MTAPQTEADDDSTPPPPATGDPSDLGFGRVVANQVRGRFLSREGVPMSRKYGLGAQRAARFYLSALNAGWPLSVGGMEMERFLRTAII